MALKGGVPVGLNDKILVAGGGGFIGGALIALLRKQGYSNLRAVDVKPLDEWYQRFDDVENLCLDLNFKENCETAAKGVTDIYNLAANMGGMGFIEAQQSAVHAVRTDQYAHAASGAEAWNEALFLRLVRVCLQRRQAENVRSAFLEGRRCLPALAEDGYGWEKLFSERMSPAFPRRFRASTRGSRVFTMFTGRGEPGLEGAKKRRRRSAAR